MTRKTSIDTYRQIEADGLLSKRRWEVYQCLYKLGPMTQGETAKRIELVVVNIDRPSITPRFAELEAMGVIETVGERACNVTGRNVLVWDVTANLPRQIDKKKELTAKDALNIAFDFLKFCSKKYDIKNTYPDVEKLRKFWIYADAKLKK